MSTDGPPGQQLRSLPPPGEIAFGPYRFDRQSRVLRHDGRPVVVPVRALAVLDELLMRPGQVVSKEDLLERIWYDAAVTEHALTETVRVLRQLLANGAPERTFIETIYGRGFRFRASTVEQPALPEAGLPAGGSRETYAEITTRLIASGRWSWLALGLAAGAVIAGILGLWRQGTENDSPPPAEMTFQVAAPGTGEIPPQGGVAISPDGSRIAFQLIRGPGTGLYVQSLAEIDAVAVPDTLSALNPFFSPDGQRVAFFKQVPAGDHFDFDLDVVDLVDGNRTTICAECGAFSWDGGGSGGAWADNGWVVFPMRGGLWRVPEAGGPPEQLLAPVEGQYYKRPKVLPGGQAVLFAIHHGPSVYGAQVAAMSLPSGPVRVLVEEASSPAYANSGHLLFARDGHILAAPLDIERLELRGEPVTVLRDVSMNDSTGHAQFAVSDDGVVLLQRGGLWTRHSRQLVRIDAQGAVAELELEPGDFRNLTVSPDGRVAAMARLQRGDADIWMLDLVANTLDRLTQGPAHDLAPVFSPDGSRIAFTSDRGGGTGIYQVTTDRTSEPELLLATEDWAYPRSWSPDGRTLTFDIQKEDGASEIWLLPLEAERTPRRFRPSLNNDWKAMFSPDGRWLAYTSSESGSLFREVYVTAFPGPGPVHRVSREGGYMARWSRNGDRIFYNLDEFWTVPVTLVPGFQVGTPEVVAGVDVTGYDVLPDGGFLATQSDPRDPRVFPTTKTLEVRLNWFEELRRLVPIDR